jgi:hypothetical protein
MEWILIVGLYALGIGLFHVLGGLAAAGETIERWGRTASTLSGNQRLSSSAG